ncbi:MAG TPA: ribonuclease III [Candidatus Wolfebacteria bacterium]|nr:ribonuclease III [Candidatus Wolfebacteria bacterium]
MDFSKLEEIIGHQFQNQKLLKESLTHRSYLNENPSWGVPHNERLEFLGDAVLELVVSEYLFKKYPDYNEGQLTSVRAALVNYQMLGKSAKNMELDKFVLLSRGEAKDTGKAREVILANAIESLIGAIYLDAGYSIIQSFIEKVILSNLQDVIENGLYRDPKSLLQEIIQEKLKITPNYKVLGEIGPDHKKIFKVGVFFDDDLAAEGEGASKQEAEVEAAKNALKTLATSD